MIFVDNERCLGCGRCKRICHEHCLSLVENDGRETIAVDHDLCSTCSQCVAICPQQALSWNQVAPVPFQREESPDPRMVEELFQQRRTIRFFKEKRIPREILQGIVQIGVYAPTNHYHLRAIVVDSPEMIEQFDPIIMRYIRLYYNLFYRSVVVFNLLRRVSPAVNSKQKVKLSRGLEHGKAFETPPAAMIFIVGDRRYIKAEASAQYALYNMILYGHTQGIGSRIQSAGPMTLDLDRKARKLLGLGRKEHILGTLDLGYPAVRFRNKVAGRSLPIQWNQEVAHA